MLLWWLWYAVGPGRHARLSTRLMLFDTRTGKRQPCPPRIRAAVTQPCTSEACSLAVWRSGIRSEQPVVMPTLRAAQIVHLVHTVDPNALPSIMAQLDAESPDWTRYPEVSLALLLTKCLAYLHHVTDISQHSCIVDDVVLRPHAAQKKLASTVRRHA